MENYDIDTIVSLFKERGNAEVFLNSESEHDKFTSVLDRFPIFEKFFFSQFKTGKKH